MQATITTKYNGPTDTRGSRVTATVTVNGARRQVSIPYDYERGTYGTHKRAACELAAKLGLGEVHDSKNGTPSGRGWRFRAEV